MVSYSLSMRGPVARRHAASVAVSLCLAMGLVLTAAGTGLAISGLASDGPAVRAQYPDADALAPGAGQNGPAVSSLADIVRARAQLLRNPRAAARRRLQEASIDRRITAALPSPTGLGVGDSGSIPLLMIGIAVLAVGGVLRWRRGVVQI